MFKSVRHVLLALIVASLVPSGAWAKINPSYDFLEAIRKNDVEEVSKLLQKGVSPDTRTRKTGEPALVIAARIGNPAVIKMILDAGANPNIADRERGETALLIASLTGRTPIVQHLLDAKADPDQTSKAIETPLIRAIQGKKTRVVKILLEAGADPTIADVSGNNAIDYARMSRSRTLIKLFEDY